MEQRRKEGKDLLLLMLPAVALAGLGLVLHSRDMSTTPAKIPTNPAFGLPQWRLSLFQDSTGTVVDTSGVKLIFPDLQTQGKGSGASSLMMSGPGGGGLNMGIGQLRLASTYAQGVNTMTVNNHTCKFEDHGMKLTIDQQTFDLSDAKHTIIVPRSGQGTLQPLALAIGGHSPAVQRHVGAGTAVAANLKRSTQTKVHGLKVYTLTGDTFGLVTKAEAAQILGSPVSLMPGGITLYTTPNGAALTIQRLPAAYFHDTARGQEYHSLTGLGDKAIYSSEIFTSRSIPGVRIDLLVLKGNTAVRLDVRCLATSAAPITPQARNLLLSKLKRLATKAIARL